MGRTNEAVKLLAGTPFVLQVTQAHSMWLCTVHLAGRARKAIAGLILGVHTVIDWAATHE